MLSVSLLSSSSMTPPPPLPKLLCSSSSSSSCFSFRNRKNNNNIKPFSLSSPLISQQLQQQPTRIFFPINPNYSQMMSKRRRSSFGTVCYAVPLSPPTLQWVCTVSSAVLLLAKGTAVQKSILVPLFALQAPMSIISWIKGEYGAWTAFLALLVRLFYFIPGELELPFVALLLAIVAPRQLMDLRGTQTGAIVSLVIAGYLAFQHFSRLGTFRSAFDQGSAIATLAVICITAVPCLLLI